jgi:hypothetical protein
MECNWLTAFASCRLFHGAAAKLRALGRAFGFSFMKVVSSGGTGITVSITHDEARILNNALNEITNGSEWSDSEFSTRVGADRKEALALLAELQRAFKK